LAFEKNKIVYWRK